MWKLRGTWIALAVVVLASLLVVSVAFAQTCGKTSGKGSSCCGDRQIVNASASSVDQQDKKAEKQVKKHECKGEACKVEGCKHAATGNSACCKGLGRDVELCTHCGQIKGGEKCCKPDMEKCEKCGLAKGSPGCCNIPDGAKEAKLCGKCGYVKGTAECCAKDMKTCDKCGLAKGSPGCCKMPIKIDTDKLCGKCGYEKGSKQCCAKDMEMCGKCGLAKGSPGCCVKCGSADCKHDHGKKVGKKDKDQ